MHTLHDLKQEIDAIKMCTWLGAPTRPPSKWISIPNTLFSIPFGASLRKAREQRKERTNGDKHEQTQTKKKKKSKKKSKHEHKTNEDKTMKLDVHVTHGEKHSVRTANKMASSLVAYFPCIPSQSKSDLTMAFLSWWGTCVQHAKTLPKRSAYENVRDCSIVSIRTAVRGGPKRVGALLLSPLVAVA